MGQHVAQLTIRMKAKYYSKTHNSGTKKAAYANALLAASIWHSVLSACQEWVWIWRKIIFRLDWLMHGVSGSSFTKTHWLRGRNMPPVLLKPTLHSRDLKQIISKQFIHSSKCPKLLELWVQFLFSEIRLWTPMQN